MADEAKVWKETIAYLFDPKNGIVLTEDEHKEIILLSTEHCEYADAMLDQINGWDYRLRKIAVNHSYPNLPHAEAKATK